MAGDNEYSIQGADFISAWNDVVWAVDPFTWIDMVAGEDYEGEIEYWVDDELGRIF